ncbi:MAG TPA: riboflavin synthase [Actinomycetota bacterium]|nr:riboflavin synthase [Actinomycetota bacterium]
MFTGIVVETGTVKRARNRRGLLELEVEAPVIARELRRGDSVAVNGVCLTATQTGRRRFSTQAMEETLARSTLGSLARGSKVNLELAARLNDRLGGHLVQGHVDGVAKVIRTNEEEGAVRVWLSAPNEVLRYMVTKGSVTLDGVSLTVVEVGRTSFQVALIPHTLGATTLGALEQGTRLNVEVDVVAKYVERLVGGER